jgi:hypothetical protein
MALCPTIWRIMRARLDFDLRLEHRKEDITDAIEAVPLTGQFQLEDKPSNSSIPNSRLKITKIQSELFRMLDWASQRG